MALKIISAKYMYVRGLRNANKRRTVFRFLHQYYPDHMVALQETHSTKLDERYWQAEWGGSILFSHGSGRECGVALLIPRSMESKCKFNEMFVDDAGRMIFADIKYDTFSLKLIAIYAPTQGHIDQQSEFYRFLSRKIEDMTEIEQNHMIVCGDMNVHMSSLDTSNSRFSLTTAANVLKKLIKDYNLVDIWRKRNPGLRRYSWRRLAPVQQSRIDYIFISKYLINNHVLRRTEIKPGVLSDHNIVSMEMNIFADDKGPGLFRFRRDLLQDDIFISAVRAEIIQLKQEEGIYNDVKDWGLKLELLLSEVRVISIKRGKELAIQRREDGAAARRQLDSCELEMCTNPSDEAVQKLAAAKRRVNEIKSEKGKRAMLYSGAR